MADEFSVKVSGLPDLKAALADVVPKLRKKALRQALTDGARLVQREARRLAPVLKLSTYSGASAVQRGIRKPGTVRKALSVRTSKIASRRGDVGVFVNVRPAKKGQRGAKSPTDPYYWQWLNFGWTPASSGSTAKERRRSVKRGDPRTRGGFRFLEGGARMLSAALSVFIRQIGPRIAKLNQKGAQP